MAQWLDRVFYNFDSTILRYMNQMNNFGGKFFNGFFSFISFLGNSGWFFIALAFIFLFFAKTRKTGIGMAIALIIGVIITNLLLKNIIARERLFWDTESELYEWWVAAGSHAETDYSFPSGHTTAAFSTMTALFILNNKKWSWVGLLFASLMAFSRIYLIAHYPTDVIAAIIIGIIAGIGGELITKLIYKRSKGKFNTALNDFDIIKFFQKKRAKGKL